MARGRFNEAIELWTFSILTVVSLSGTLFMLWAFLIDLASIKPKSAVGLVILIFCTILGLWRFIRALKTKRARHIARLSQKDLEVLEIPIKIIKPPLHRVKRGRW